MCMIIKGTKKLSEGEIVYKVVRKDQGRYFSLTSQWNRSQQEGFNLGAEFYYNIGQLHTSDAPGIYVFQHKEDALEHRISSRAILKCYIPKGSNIYFGTQHMANVYGAEKLIVLEEV